MASVSVIVPVYRVEKYIHRCVDSILNQTFRDFELILVDDGSPDRCGAMCEAYAAADPRIHVIHRENGGLSAARNTGIEWMLENSDSEYLTFVDSDDWLHPQYLEIMLQSAKRHGTAISVCNHAYVIDFDRNKLNPLRKAVKSKRISAEDLLVDHEWNFNYACVKLYHRDCFQRVRYPVGKVFEDTFTTYKILFAAEYVTFIDCQLYFYYRNTEGITRSPWSARELSVLEGMRQQMAFYQEKGFSRAFEKEERLYVNHYAYQLTRIRENRADWEKNKPIWYQLRREMLALLKEKRALYNRATMPQCYEAAWPVWARMKLRLGNAAQVLRREGIRGIALRLRQILGGT